MIIRNNIMKNIMKLLMREAEGNIIKDLITVLFCREKVVTDVTSFVVSVSHSSSFRVILVVILDGNETRHRKPYIHVCLFMQETHFSLLD